ncbi:MAG: hypothetical protein HKM95_14730 [Inquilinus sp.]|nr:hypothetical protein [Inquilinus sp.]
MSFPRGARAPFFGVVVTAAITIAAGPVQATEGYFQHGYGVVSKSLAGTGAAFSQDAMSQALNPAGLVNVGNQVEFGLSLFSPRREVTGSGASGSPGAVPTGTVDSDSEFFVIPNIGASYQIDDVSAVGVALYGNGGMNTDYPALARPVAECGGGSGIFCGGGTGVDLSQSFLQFTYAREVADGVSVGVGPILAVQFFEARGLTAFSPGSSDPANLTDNDHDTSYGFGGRIGIQAELSPEIRVGAAYQLRTYMSEFDDYRGLFAEQGDFDIPPALQVGLSWQPADNLTLLFDYKRIWYGDVNSVGNPFSSPGLLGDENGPGFGWDDIDVFKIGAQWEVDEKWTVRGGYSYSENPISSSEVLFNILAPGVMEHHITGGVSYQLSDSSTAFLGAALFAPSSDVSGPNPQLPAQNIDLEMHQFEISFGMAWQF